MNKATRIKDGRIVGDRSTGCLAAALEDMILGVLGIACFAGPLISGVRDLQKDRKDVL